MYGLAAKALEMAMQALLRSDLDASPVTMSTVASVYVSQYDIYVSCRDVSGRERSPMWEWLTIVVCSVGFAVAVTVLLVEVPRQLLGPSDVGRCHGPRLAQRCPRWRRGRRGRR